MEKHFLPQEALEYIKKMVLDYSDDERLEDAVETLQKFIYEQKGKRKKITLKEFWESKIHSAIHCKTQEEANEFARKSHKLGKTWGDGDSYLIFNHWVVHKEETYYDNQGTGAYKDYYLGNQYNVYEFEDVDWD